MKTEKHFDENIRKALESLERPFDADAWKAFEERLESETLSEEPILDKIVFGKLEELEAPLSAGSWALMQQMIEADEAAEVIESEAAIDNTVQEKIGNIRAPYRQQHWQLMAHRLEQELQLRYSLYSYKIAEVALMTLLLLAIARFVPEIEKTHSGPVVSNAAYPTRREPVISENKNQVSDLIISADDQSNKALRPASNTSDLALKGGGQVPGGDNGGFGTASADSRNLSLLPAGNLKNIEYEDNAEIGKSRKLSTALQMPESEFGLTSLATKIGQVKPDYTWETPRIALPLPSQKKELRFSILSTTDINYVFTPSAKLSVFDTLIATSSDTTAAGGYGAGILVSWKKEKWEVQTGGIYSFKRYIPNTPVFLFKTVNYYIREDFHGIQLDLLQVPLNVQYHFVDNGNWRFYGLGGISNHFVASSVYEIERTRLPNFAYMSPIPSMPEDDRSIRQEKEFPDGLVDGGSLKNNYFLTANIGLGVERYITPRWSVFAQPNYQHYLLSEGIGANKDKFYTFSIYLGTKFGLR